MSSDKLDLGRTTGISRRKTLWIMLTILIMVGGSFGAAQLGLLSPQAAPSGGHGAALRPLAALTITGSASPAQVTLGSSSTLSIRASGGTSPYTYAWTSLPSPCTATSSSTSISCRPSSAGTYYITVWVTDHTGAYNSVTITLQVVWAQLEITSFSASPNPVLNNSFLSISASVTGGLAPYNYTYNGLPPGCVTSWSNFISCSPKQTGAYQIKVTVKDSGGNVTQALTVLSVQTAIFTTLTISAFSSSSNPAYVNSATTISVTASGGAPPYTYAYHGVPTGCAASGASWSCTPTSVGTNTLRVWVNDSNGNSTSQQLVLKILSMAITGFTAAPNPAYVSGPDAPASFTFTTTVQGAIGWVNYVYTGLPYGCPSVNASSVTCTSRVAKTYTVEVFATDSVGDASATSRPARRC